ncbi:CsbD family protein [Nocardiopsis gilva YIM 90087]|uniref:CsbD family protein n=1 Tax=Nocardiopsis gilva YIM 90087 TaxID=1235441 RepID=A0A223SCH6_9ACTN|nr:CsbD family protein [Nocardiopsis gilva]ASU85786.1 CsbD family protein [Nocardiopsis gilva YIM 90087]
MGNIENEFENAKGKAKETAGKAMGDSELETEGKLDQAKAGIEDAAEDVKEKAGETAEKIKNVFKR